MSNHITTLDFSDLEPIQVEFSIGGKSYVMFEATADAAVKYRNRIARSASFADGKLAKVENPADAETLLVSLCLFEKVVTKDGSTGLKPVTEAQVRGFQQRIQRRLFDELIKISELGAEETRESLLATIQVAQEKLAKMDEEGISNRQRSDLKNELNGMEESSCTVES